MPKRHVKNNELDAAYKKGLCDCLNNHSQTLEPELYFSAPLIMAPRADRSGEAILLVDISNDGLVNNIRAAAYTEKMFADRAISTAENFIYTKAHQNSDPSKRYDVPIRFLFNLERDDNRVPAKKLKTIIPIIQNLDMMTEDNLFTANGVLMRRSFTY